MIEPAHLAAYVPPPTNAESVTPWNGQLTPITSESALVLFSSDADVTRLLPLVQAVDANARVFDGQGIECPEIDYGSDGRKVNCVQGMVTIGGASYSYVAAFGVLVAASYWGPMWNGMHQPPYTLLVADVVDSADAQIDWSH